MTSVSRQERVEGNDSGMTDRNKESTPRGRGRAQPKAKSGATEARQARLAAALRENLRRRKKAKPAGKAD